MKITFTIQAECETLDEDQTMPELDFDRPIQLSEGDLADCLPPELADAGVTDGTVELDSRDKPRMVKKLIRGESRP